MSELGNVQQDGSSDNVENHGDSEAFKKARESGEQRGYRRAAAEYEAELAKYKSQLEQRNQQTNVPQGTLTVEDANKLIEERINQMQQGYQQNLQQQQAEKIANNYLHNVGSARPEYEDFDETIKLFNPAEESHLTYLLSERPDAGHILYDLMKNPRKLADLSVLSQRYPEHAVKMIAELGDSIKENRKAAQDYKSSDRAKPLPGRDLQSSNITGGNGKSSIGALRRNPAFRK